MGEASLTKDQGTACEKTAERCPGRRWRGCGAMIGRRFRGSGGPGGPGGPAQVPGGRRGRASSAGRPDGWAGSISRVAGPDPLRARALQPTDGPATLHAWGLWSTPPLPGLHVHRRLVGQRSGATLVYGTTGALSGPLVALPGLGGGYLVVESAEGTLPSLSGPLPRLQPSGRHVIITESRGTIGFVTGFHQPRVTGVGTSKHGFRRTTMSP